MTRAGFTSSAAYIRTGNAGSDIITKFGCFSFEDVNLVRLLINIKLTPRYSRLLKISILLKFFYVAGDAYLQTTGCCSVFFYL